MVFIRRDEGYWRTYFKVARTRVIKALPWIAAFLFVYGVFLFTENAIGDDFHTCISNETAYYSQNRQNNHQNSPPLPLRFAIQNVCSLGLVDRHNGFFALLGTIAVACFTLTLWRSTDKLWKSAEATAARQLRAYVHMEIQKGNRIDVNGNRVSYQIALANSGQTPAWHVVTHAAICLAKYPLVDPLPPLETQGEGSKMAIHPNQGPVTSRIGVNLTNDQFDLLQPPSDGTGNPSPYRLYLYGKISYEDVFNREWKTNFRLSTNGHQVLHAEFLWCAEGNEAT